MLRYAGIQVPIVVMSGFSNAHELAVFYQYGLSSVIHQERQIELLEQYACHTHRKRDLLRVWFKIDSGMHRLGFALVDSEAAYQRLKAIPTVHQPIGLMTHLASADIHADWAREETNQQIQAFLGVTHAWSGPKSILNSAGILDFSDVYRGDWIRPGGLLYGVSPGIDPVAAAAGLRPVMTLQAKLIAIKTIPKGAAVGYGSTWRSEETMPIGIVGMGYGDGYPWHAPSGTPVLCRNTLCSLVGRVAMDMIAIDLRSAPHARLGDRVTIWGQGLPIETIAAAVQTIPYALLCGVTARVQYVDGEPPDAGT